jgi:predicted DNA-binding protein with PD1-like motif
VEYVKANDHYWVRLEKDEEIFESLLEFAAKENLQAASVSGIGAVKNADIGCYDLDRKEYDSKNFPDIMELISATGNISQLDGKPFLHLHGVISGHDYLAKGGHFFKAYVGVTCEFVIIPLDHKVQRVMNNSIGLCLLDFKE